MSTQINSKSKKVLLVHPPFHSFFEYDRWGFPLNCCQLAGSLKKKGIEACVYDGDKYFKKDLKTRNREEMINRQHLYREGLENENHYIWQHLRNTLQEVKPDIVGVTMWSSSFESGIKALKIIKESNPEIKTCVGGYHVKAMDELGKRTFIDNLHVDGVFVGFSDDSLANWIFEGCKEKLIKTNPSDLDILKIAHPDRGALLYGEHFNANDMGMILTSSGCPYHCTFCSNDILTHRKYQFRTDEQIRTELDEIVSKYGVTRLNLVDANFLSNKKRALEVAELFNSFNLKWSCPAHVHSVDDEVVEKLMANGCDILSLGIESGCQERLIKINKRTKLYQIEDCAKILNRHNVTWNAHFITGWVDDSIEEMEETRSFALKINPTYIALNTFVPLPATDIYAQWREQLELYDLAKVNQLSTRQNYFKNMGPEQYTQKFLEMIRDFDEHNKKRKTLYTKDLEDKK